MPDDLGAHIMKVAIKIAKAVKSQLSPDGLNLIQANEMAAGQTIPHFHLHIVPRYKHDGVTLRFGHGDIPADLNELEPNNGWMLLLRVITCMLYLQRIFLLWISQIHRNCM